MKPAPRILCAHDLSGVGRCSLTSAIPILSAAGLETCALPTALLSTQTGGIEGYTYLDLTEEMSRILAHWQSLSLSFDGIYTGYLGSAAQIPLMEETVSRYDTAFALIDPVMGDSGALYGGFTPDYVTGFARLLSHADLTTPNYTEACLLSGLDPKTLISPALARDLCLRVRDLGVAEVVLTGYEVGDAIGCLFLAQDDDTPREYLTPRVEGIYHGCGDVFSSSLMACRMKGLPLGEACRRAADFTHHAIRRTHDLGLDSRFGMDFERELPVFAAALS